MRDKWFQWLLIATAFFLLGASLGSCEKGEILTEEELLYQECNGNHYNSEGLVGVYICMYGSLEALAMNPDAPYRHRKTAWSELGLTRDPLVYGGLSIGEGQCINGPCNVEIIPDPAGQPNAYQDDNGYWHLEYTGAKYFQAKLKFSLSKLGNSARPDIVTEYTSDKWMLAKDGFSFWSSRYNPLGSDYTNNFRTAIADTMVVVSIPPNEVKELVNASGQYYRDCNSPGCGIGPEPKSFSGVGHTTKAQFLYFPDMARVHDTIRAYFTTSFYNENFKEEVVKSELKIIL